MVMKLTRYAAYDGQRLSSADHSAALPAPSASCGTFSSSTSSVTAIANTPSLNASIRPVSFSSAIGMLTGTSFGCSDRLLDTDDYTVRSQFILSAEEAGGNNVSLSVSYHWWRHD